MKLVRLALREPKDGALEAREAKFIYVALAPELCRTGVGIFEARGCQEKRLLPAPRRDAGVVTYIQPSHSHKGDWLAGLARRRLQRRCQPQLLVVPTQRFHDVVMLDTIRFRSYAR